VVYGTPQIHPLPAIRTTISSGCQRLLGRGRHRRSRRAITGFIGDVEPSLDRGKRWRRYDIQPSRQPYP
jgi:hypothetical protein